MSLTRGFFRWSPDGKRILFHSDRSGVWELWIMNADGTELRQLAKRPGANMAVWPPDGTHIAFFDVNASDVFVFAADKPWDEQELLRLPRPPSPMSIFLVTDWSPDGPKLVGETLANGIAVYSFASRSRRHQGFSVGRCGSPTAAAWRPPRAGSSISSTPYPASRY